MHYTINIDLTFSLFGLVFFGLLIWGGYRGYRRGGIIMGLSLFALAIGFVVSGALTKLTYIYFFDKSDVPEVFGAIVLGTTFIAAIWFSAYIQKIVRHKITDVESDKTNNYIGMALGIAKFFLIAAVYSVVILNLDCKGHFLPERDRKSYTLNFSKNILYKTVRMLRMDKHLTAPCYPEDYKNKSQNNNNKNNGLGFPEEKNGQNKNNTNKNNSNNSERNSNPIVEDINP